MATSSKSKINTDCDGDSSDKDFALQYTAAGWLHRSLVVPATGAHGPLRVTYSVVGLPDEAAPVVLFCGGMFGGRWVGLFMHTLAVKIGVRLVNVDRPGFGGSTPVPIQQRIKVWLETVPCLLNQLKATRVALVAASSGTIFLLNTLYYLPHILPTKTPYVAFLAPWVHPKQSYVTSMTIASHIPNKLIANYWNKVSFFVATTLRPAFQSSRGMLSSAPLPAKPAPNKDEVTKSFETLGMTIKQRDATLEATINFLFAEDTTGANDEALLCLKKGGEAETAMWDICDDYEAFVPTLSSKWKQEFPGSKLKIQAYFAEDDIMVGKRGAEYFKKCWNEEACGETILFEGIQTYGTTHDNMGDPTHAILEAILRQAKGSLEGVKVEH